MYGRGVLKRRRDGAAVYYAVSDPNLVTLCRTACVHIAGQQDDRPCTSRTLKRFMLEAVARIAERERACARPARSGEGASLPPPENHLSRNGARGAAVTARFPWRPRRRGDWRAVAAGACSWPREAVARPAERAGVDALARRAGGGATATACRRSTKANVQRRQSPGLTPQPQSSVSFTPLQNLFGIITPSGLHFERHHRAGAGHRPVAAPADDPRPGASGRADVFTMDDIDALSVGVAHPLHRVRRQHRHGVGQRRGADRAVHARHARLQRVHRRAAVDAARRGAASTRRTRKFVLAEGADGSATDAHDPDGDSRSTT